MATSLFFLASTEPAVPESSTNFCGCEDSKPDHPRTSTGRKGAKSAAGRAPKKQPQRGMGVAQLEKLRNEELKKMAGIGRHLQPVSVPGHFRFPYQFLEPSPAPASDPVPTGFGPPLGWVPRFGGGAFHGFGGGFRVVDPYGNGGAVGSTREASRELSSIPKTDCVSDNCNVCLKKKRMNAGKLGFSGRRGKYGETPPINCFDFLGLGTGNDEKKRGFKPRSPMTAVQYSCHNHSEEAEVVAVHRRRNSVDRSVFIEYEFFPGKGGDAATAAASTPVGGGGGEGCLAMPTSADASTSSRSASNLVDLSLKLSY